MSIDAVIYGLFWGGVALVLMAALIAVMGRMSGDDDEH